ncbi:MAG TPA: hypothetical protein VML94_00295 [Thermoplasmata archaeon]|nr:hypothetical protein [Thermoplasmata archaeon]
MEARRPARGIAQRRLDPDLSDEGTPSEPEPAIDVAAPIEKPKRAPIEEMPGGSASALQERQRRWLAERARFEAADRAARAADQAASSAPEQV